MAALLYEIGTEELPAGYIEPALEQLRENLARMLSEHRLEADSIQVAGTPRRLTVAAQGVPERQAPEVEKTLGPPARVAYNEDGSPTEAAEGFARSQGVTVEELTVEETEKGPYVAAARKTEGRATVEVLPAILRKITLDLSFPKSMHWTSGGIQFARPVRWLLALLDEDVVPVVLDGVEAGRLTRGHAFLRPETVALQDASFENYEEALRERYVLVRLEERREQIGRQIMELLGSDASVAADDELLHEVANLVEYPCAAEGVFNESFLQLPDCVLMAAMVEHQRYFPVRGADGRLLPRFVVVMDRSARQRDTVVEGNERVLTARLEDARFYWNKDREVPLGRRVEERESVVFLGGLGDNLERTTRLERLSENIADLLGLSDEQVGRCVRAARLCKADLVTGLVGEFPSLQGVVGGELARWQGEDAEVARAIAEHYRPAGADDELPNSVEGTILSIADKIDVIVGCFALGLEPTGSKDPYALRRNSQATLTMMAKKNLDVKLGRLISLAGEGYSNTEVAFDEETHRRVFEFFGDRLYHMAVDRGVRHDFVRAVLAEGFDNVRNFWIRLRALLECSRKDWWPALVELVDRTYRIQKDAEELPALDENLLQEQEEQELAQLLDSRRDEVLDAFRQEDYVRGAEIYCSALAEPVHEFFEEVFVNVEDRALRLNRMRLCTEVYRLFAAHFADLYRIETAPEQE